MDIEFCMEAAYTTTKWRRPQNEDDLRNEDDLKNGDDLKNEDNLKNEDGLKNEDDLKNEYNIKIKTVPGPSLHNLSCAYLFKKLPFSISGAT